MLHACVQRFDATGTVGNFLGTKHGLSLMDWNAGHTVQEEEDATTVQSQAAAPRDIFRLRQIQRSRGLGVGGAAAASQSGSSAFSFSGGGSAFSGDHSASTD